MAIDFDVSFRQATNELIEFSYELAGAGKQADLLRKNSKDMAGSMAKSFRDVAKKIEGVEKALEQWKLASEETGLATDMAMRRATKAYDSVATASFNAALKAKALGDTNDALHGTFLRIANDTTYTRFASRIAALSTETSSKLAFEKAKLEELSSARARELAVAQALVRQKEKELQQFAQNAIAIHKATDAAANYAAIIGQLEKAEREMAVTGERLAWGYERISQATASATIQQERAKQAMDAANASILQGVRNLAELEMAQSAGSRAAAMRLRVEQHHDKEREASLASLKAAIIERYAAEDRAAAATAAKLAADRAAQKAATEARYAELAKLQAEIRRLTQAEADQAAKHQAAVTASAAYNDNLMRNAQAARMAGDATLQYAAAVRKVQEGLGTSGSSRINTQIAELAAGGRKASVSLEALSTTEAKLRLVESRLATELELRNRATTAAVSANNALTAADHKRIETLAQYVRQQEALAAAANKTTRQLLGMRSASERAEHQIKLNNQATAAFRATLSGLNASIGIYTSATIAIASLTYAMAAAFRETVKSGTEFGETMSRVEAIMFSGADRLGDSAASLGAVEAQIRALGQSTIFTSSQVAKGMVDLGMAGLNATDAMLALKPALDLASIGAIEMGTSADIITNVMTTFKMEANDLAQIVDVMAVAVTNSNTNIEQLANALTYVGPAAEAAGFEFRDTVAVLELLANAGIKASKAGTGLRRFMLNVQNPTAKGAKVLETYNIQLDDANGNTRSLIDIIGQFGVALNKDGITPATRMAAIVDLVGVRAASATSRMISSFDELVLVRHQLEEVTGAADNMRKSIEDNLGSDWKKVKSAFQELQLQVFDVFEDRARETASSVALAFQKLSLPDDLSDPNGPTGMTILIAEMSRAADVALALGAAFVSLKAAALLNSFLSAEKGSLASGMSRLSVTTDVLTTRLYANATAHRNVAQAQMVGTAATARSAVAMGSLATTAAATTAQVSALAAGLSRVALAAAPIAGMLGWVGLIIGIGSAITYAFSDTGEYIDEHTKKIAEAQKAYADLEEQSRKTQNEINRLALLKQAGNIQKEIEAVTKQIGDNEIAIKVVTDTQSIHTLEMRTKTLQDRLDKLKGAAESAEEALALKGATAESYKDILIKQDELAAKIADVARELEKSKDAMKGSAGAMASAGVESNRLAIQLEKLNAELLDTQVEAKKASRALYNYNDMLVEALAKQNAVLNAEAAYERLSVTGKIIAKQKELSEITANVSAMQNLSDDEKSLNGYLDAQEKALKINKELNDLQVEYEDTLSKSRQEMREGTEELSHRNDSLDTLRKRLAEVNSQIADMDSKDKGGALIEADKYTKLIKLQGQLASEVASKEDELANARTKSADKGVKAADKQAAALKKLTEEARKVFESLREEYAPIDAAVIKFHDQVKMLESLKHATGEARISQEEFNLALAQMSKNLAKVVQENDPFFKGLDEMKSKYLSFIEEIKQLEQDGQNLGKYFSGPTLELATGEWQKQRDAQLTDGMPTVDDSLTGSEDLYSLESQDAEQQKWYDSQIARHKQMLEAKEIDEKAYTERVRRLTQIRGQQIEKTEHLSNASRLAATADLFGGLASLSATYAGDNATITKTMMAFEQAANLALVISNMAASQAKGFAELGPIAGAAAAVGVAAQTASLIGTITSIVSPAEPSYSTSNYSGAYDKGGYIPAGKFGVVGEYGPELVHGPAAVTGRRETAAMYGGKDGGSVTFAPVIQVTVEAKDSQVDAKRQGDMIAAQVNAAVLTTLHKEIRPNGLLDSWKRGKY